MPVTRSAAAAAFLATTLAASCTGSGDGKSSTSPPTGPSANSDGTGTEHCTANTAVKAKFTLIDAAGFKPSCVKIKIKGQFLFINEENRQHALRTRAGSPTTFRVTLPQKTSTYSANFRRKGRCVVVDTTTHKQVTLFVK